MSVQLKLKTTKPENIDFWWKINPTKMTIIDDFIKALPGFISYSQSLTNSNERSQTIVFDTNENLQNYFSKIYTCTQAVERKTYNDSNGIVTTSKIDII
jgi:hypothetical protein